MSFDFAITQLPGWHFAIFPPYFVAGAIYSGFAMVLQLMIPARRLFGLQDVITRNHLDNMAKMLLVTGWVVTYTYLVEPFMAWWATIRTRPTTPSWTALSARTVGYWGVSSATASPCRPCG